ncbi:MAG: twin-arginine translocase TatA/TatE family subunit [Acidimicrobiaceae bacterium]|nr:twin-arginine translocase TatA/TatE family subunit [Acidimicrobiaceae bacterium]
MLSANIFGPDLGIIVLVILAVLLFGSQAPKIARNLGSAGKEFRKAQEEADEQHARERAAEAAKAQPEPPKPITGTSEDKIQLTQSELNALLAARESQAKQQSS